MTPKSSRKAPGGHPGDPRSRPARAPPAPRISPKAPLSLPAISPAARTSVSPACPLVLGPPASKPTSRKSHGPESRHRRSAQCGQVDPVQRPNPDGGGPGRQLSVLHHRAERRRSGGARAAAGRAGRRSPGRRRSSPPGSPSSTSPAWCAARPRARGSATSSWPTSATATPSPWWRAASSTTEIAHVEGRIDPLADLDIIDTELMIADLDSLEKRVPALEKRAKGGNKEALARPAAGPGWPSEAPKRWAAGQRSVRVAEEDTEGLAHAPAAHHQTRPLRPPTSMRPRPEPATNTPPWWPSGRCAMAPQDGGDLGPDRERDRGCWILTSGPSSWRPWAWRNRASTA